MPRIARLVMKGEPAVYHVISRTALDGFVLGDVEKDHLLHLMRHLAAVYFVEVLGFCIMGNHWHLLVRMHTGEGVSDEEVRERFRRCHGATSKRAFTEGQIPLLREKWASLSEFVKDLKQTFSRWYNKTRGRRGFFWGERFKSVLVDTGDTLVNCLAYIDLNPVRAGMVGRPEEYRWCSLAYHVQTGNGGGFLSLDLGLRAFGSWDDRKRLRYYREYVYGIGSQRSTKGAKIDDRTMAREEKKGYELTAADRLLFRTRYFTDSGVIGSKEFVSRCYRLFESHFTCRHEKRPRGVAGLEGVFSLKRLAGG
ncbi:MAG: transposase [Deltaproteobacteria bacterium]|nr:transposase [Deltaproteobacteria bacterium]